MAALSLKLCLARLRWRRHCLPKPLRKSSIDGVKFNHEVSKLCCTFFKPTSSVKSVELASASHSVLKTVDRDHSSSQGLVVKANGFSLHAGVSCKSHERKKLEKICRYIARPAISEERLSVNAKGQVVYRLKKAYEDGTTHIVMEPMQFMEKLSAIIPRPRVHLTRFHGILAPHDKHRKHVVPKSAEVEELTKAPAEVKILTLHEQLLEKKKKTQRMSWARLLKRVFNIDVETCGSCGGKMRIIAAVEEAEVIKKILDHLGLPSTPPLARPARGPPLAIPPGRRARGDSPG